MLRGTSGMAAGGATANDSSARTLELLESILVELRTMTEFLKQGLNVAEEPDVVRGDEATHIN